MKFLILLILCSCSKVPEILGGRIVTDSDGCKYIVERNIGDTLFLRELKDFKCVRPK